MEYAYNVTTGGSSGVSWTMPLTISNGSYVYGGSGNYNAGADAGYVAPAPRPQTALEWLDAEIEATCKLARQAS